ncbi:hypothetical protein [Actinomadura gamaensis]|uniref:Uncharacterized protein n=1 Tax=Actinomadura gamaensis TaxID=1763541 RepID=A0ABV9U7N0_9ACTN
MLRVYCFDTLAVTVEDVYLREPDPQRGGDERGVRVELRPLAAPPWQGSPNASQPLACGPALWRADLLESVAGGPGTKDRMHHHPGMSGGEPGPRVFVPALTADPILWLRDRLADVTPMLEAARVTDAASHKAAVAALRDAAPELAEIVGTVLGEVRAGRLATSGH